MKKKSIIALFVSLFGFGMTTTSCEDMLTPEVDLYASEFTGTDTVNFYFGILANLQDVIENNVMLGDIRSDVADTTNYVSDSVASLANFDKVADGDNALLNRSAYYKVINQCNFYLAKVDTMMQKNNNYYMRREFAQVQVVRAWTYMQLVQNYGRVPFIVSPIDNAGTGWEVNPECGWAAPDNLLDLLMQHGLNQAYVYEKTLGSPSYHTLNNGAMAIDHSLMVFPVDLVLGDLYLLRGASKADYVQAATHYYNYLQMCARDKNRYVTLGVRANVNKAILNGTDYYSKSARSWASDIMDEGTGVPNNGEVITLVASAANNTFGTVLTRSAGLYGFTTSSTNTTETNQDSEGNDVTSTTGRVTVTADYRARQMGASRKYIQLSESQLYRFEEYSSQGSSSDAKADKITYPKNVGDARIAGSVANVRTTIGTIPFIQKRCFGSGTGGGTFGLPTNSFSFNYTLPVYRLRQVFLRYAEAINRAGYPRHAFAILRDGLTSKTIPAVRLDYVKDGKVLPYASLVEDGCNYIYVDELRRAQNEPFMDFKETYWDTNVGIHEMGCGISSDLDTLYTYDLIVGQRMADEDARTRGTVASDEEVKALQALLMAEKGESPYDNPVTGEGGEETEEGEGTEEGGEGTEEGGEEVSPEEAAPANDPVIPENIGAQINAVETLIADEMAMETAFEGFRFYDLSRIARHKNNDTWGYSTGDFGTAWFAWSIARRSESLKPYELPTQMNTALYNKLLTIDNWYLQNPQY